MGSSIPFYAKRFVAGTDLEGGIKVTKALNTKGISASVDLLGENIHQKEQAAQATQEYLKLLQQLHLSKLDAHISIKLTLLGLDIDEEFCKQNLKEVLQTAQTYNIRVALDMEGSGYTERTLSIYEQMSAKYSIVEAVLQAYLKRTPQDVERVLNAGGRLRLCKGAYKERPDTALQDMNAIREQYKILVEKCLKNATRVCIATHDDALIAHCMNFIKTNQIPKERYEFQMLYGLRAKTWVKIRQLGHNMTVYVPYGHHWQAYFSRRLAERKENVLFILRNFFKS